MYISYVSIYYVLYIISHSSICIEYEKRINGDLLAGYPIKYSLANTNTFCQNTREEKRLEKRIHRAKRSSIPMTIINRVLRRHNVLSKF